jgi:hypothetical protein
VTRSISCGFFFLANELSLLKRMSKKEKLATR